MMAVRVPLLVLGWGNRGRGDDALGPLCVAAMEERLHTARRDRVEFLEEYQLQIEHVLDLRGRSRILLIDASQTCRAPFELLEIQAKCDSTYVGHVLSPEALLHIYRGLYGQLQSSVILLAIRGEEFELGVNLSALAQRNLEKAVTAALVWVEGVDMSEGRRTKAVLPD